MNKETKDKEIKLSNALLKIRKNHIKDVDWDDVDSTKITKIYYVLEGIY